MKGFFSVNMTPSKALNVQDIVRLFGEYYEKVGVVTLNLGKISKRPLSRQLTSLVGL